MTPNVLSIRIYNPLFAFVVLHFTLYSKIAGLQIRQDGQLRVES